MSGSLTCLNIDPLAAYAPGWVTSNCFSWVWLSSHRDCLPEKAPRETRVSSSCWSFGYWFSYTDRLDWVIPSLRWSPLFTTNALSRLTTIIWGNLSSTDLSSIIIRFILLSWCPYHKLYPLLNPPLHTSASFTTMRVSQALVHARLRSDLFVAWVPLLWTRAAIRPQPTQGSCCRVCSLICSRNCGVRDVTSCLSVNWCWTVLRTLT